MANKTIRFVNRTRSVQRFPTRRGGRTALAPDEFFTDPYYERFSRLHTQPNPNGKRPLVQEYEDGTPVGVDELPEDTGVKAPTPDVATPPKKPTTAPPPPTNKGCGLSCETSCEFPSESEPTVANDINQQMDKDAKQPEEPLPDSMPEDPAPPTAAESIQSTESDLEPGMAPPMPSPQSQPTTELPPVTQPSDGSAAPPPQVNEGVQGRATPQEVMDHFSLEDQDIIAIEDNWVTYRKDGVENYASRLELGWTTHSITAMKAHVTRKTNTLD